jgi:soluble lytic murein transglycosylase-like protein
MKADKKEILAAIHTTAQQLGINPLLAQGLFEKESSLNPMAYNKSSGAMGLGQLLPETALQYGVTNPFDSDQNIKGSLLYLRHLLKTNKGSVALALKKYGGFVKADPTEYILSVTKYLGQHNKKIELVFEVHPEDILYLKSILGKANRNLADRMTNG